MARKSRHQTQSDQRHSIQEEYKRSRGNLQWFSGRIRHCASSAMEAGITSTRRTRMCTIFTKKRQRRSRRSRRASSRRYKHGSCPAVKRGVQQKAAYGADATHVYAADPFNEMAPSGLTPTVAAAVSKNIYTACTAADPHCVWYELFHKIFRFQLVHRLRLRTLSITSLAQCSRSPDPPTFQNAVRHLRFLRLFPHFLLSAVILYLLFLPLTDRTPPHTRKQYSPREISDAAFRRQT